QPGYTIRKSFRSAKEVFRRSYDPLENHGNGSHGGFTQSSAAAVRTLGYVLPAELLRQKWLRSLFPRFAWRLACAGSVPGPTVILLQLCQNCFFKVDLKNAGKLEKIQRNVRKLTR